MTRIAFDIFPSMGQGNSLSTFSTSPTLSDSSIAFGKASIVSAATNEALGTAIDFSHPPRFKTAMTMAGLRVDVEIPLPISPYGIRHLKGVWEPDRPQGRHSLGAGNDPVDISPQPCWLSSQGAEVPSPSSSPLTKESPARLLSRVQSTRIVQWK